MHIAAEPKISNFDCEVRSHKAVAENGVNTPSQTKINVNIIIPASEVAVNKLQGSKKSHSICNIHAHLEQLALCQQSGGVTSGPAVSQKVTQVSSRGKLQYHHHVLPLCAYTEKPNDLCVS